MKKFFLVMLFFSTAYIAKAQDDKIPSAISDLFYMQYPYATNIKVDRKLLSTDVEFYMKGDHYLAVYKKGEWQYSLMDYTYNRLPAKVKKGFKATKYGTNDVLETTLVYLPSGYEEYRLKLKEDSFNGRYIYINENGKVIKVTPGR